jgi:large subunit ribosomal protein L10
MPKKDKIELVDSIKGDLKEVQGVVLGDFKSMTVLELETLRKKVVKDGGRAKVVKNNLLKKAFEGSNINGMEPYLKNNTILFSSKEDVMKLLKSLADYSKENEKFVIKAGYVDGQVLDKDSVIALSKMPSRKELLSMIAGGLNSVLSSFVGTLNGVMTSFVGTIEALEKKKG